MDDYHRYLSESSVESVQGLEKPTEEDNSMLEPVLSRIQSLEVRIAE